MPKICFVILVGLMIIMMIIDYIGEYNRLAKDKFFVKVEPIFKGRSHYLPKYGLYKAIYCNKNFAESFASRIKKKTPQSRISPPFEILGSGSGLLLAAGSLSLRLGLGFRLGLGLALLLTLLLPSVATLSALATSATGGGRAGPTRLDIYSRHKCTGKYLPSASQQSIAPGLQSTWPGSSRAAHIHGPGTVGRCNHSRLRRR
ncbi:MAG: hypothetical protein QMD77_04170 [Patescibacteria group bacterium]|nr:hypothetical protein [Patescibacteria group bacterium]